MKYRYWYMWAEPRHGQPSPSLYSVSSGTLRDTLWQLRLAVPSASRQVSGATWWPLALCPVEFQTREEMAAREGWEFVPLYGEKGEFVAIIVRKAKDR